MGNFVIEYAILDQLYGIEILNICSYVDKHLLVICTWSEFSVFTGIQMVEKIFIYAWISVVEVVSFLKGIIFLLHKLVVSSKCI